MNGVHDMGGMHGFGPIAPQAGEPLFHAAWEERAFALTLAMGAWRRWTLDGARHARERIAPADYLRMSYYERWIEGLILLLTESGLVTADELASGRAQTKTRPPLAADAVVALLQRGAPTERATAASPHFRPGDAVRARNLHPVGHTRLPRYVRGKTGVIDAHYGAHVFADAHAHGPDEQPQPLYCVRFSARTLWGDAAAAQDEVCVDLWESHLEPA